MTNPDDDLRSAFQRWRQQDAAAAPVFPGIPERHPRLPARPRVFLLPASLAAAAAVLLLLLIPHYKQHTLMEALPRPLLSPALGESSFLAGLDSQTVGSVSDFLQPIGSFSSTTLF